MHQSHVFSKWPGTKGTGLFSIYSQLTRSESLLSARIILLGTYVAVNVFIALMVKFKLSVGFAPVRQPMKVINSVNYSINYVSEVELLVRQARLIT
jgi:hypothetical protein